MLRQKLIKFSKRYRNRAATLQKLSTFYACGKTTGFSMYSAFKSGRDVVENLPCSGRPSTSSTEVNIANVKEMVTENCHLSLREIAAELSVSRINSYHFKRLFGHKMRCYSTSSERPEFYSKTQSRKGQKLNEYHRTTTLFT